MHDCQKFREDWIAGISGEDHDCQDCRSFCEEAAAILKATDSTALQVPEFSEDYWNEFEDRMRENLLLENASKASTAYWKWSALAAAAAVVAVMTWSGARVTQPLVDHPQAAPHLEFKNDHIEGLDPMVVAFLGQSELFLRSFTKIEPAYVEDLDDARARARRDLMEIMQQKNLAGDFVPVRITLDEYEGVLRDIKNLDSSEDLAEIQMRIRRNGLIANLKAYQPHATLVSQR